MRQSGSTGLQLVLSNALVTSRARAVCSFFSNFSSLPNGFLHDLKCSSPFRTVCSKFSHALVPLGRFAPSVRSPFRAACSFVSHALLFLSLCWLVFSQQFQSLSSGFPVVLKSSEHFRAVGLLPKRSYPFRAACPFFQML